MVPSRPSLISGAVSRGRPKVVVVSPHRATADDKPLPSWGFGSGRRLKR